MSESKIRLKKHELSKILDIVNKINSEDDFVFEIIEKDECGIGSILVIVCEIELGEIGVKGKFQVEISGPETW